MRWQEYPVLAEEEPLVDELAVALDQETARVLAYLLLRETESLSEPASRLEIRIGTGLGRDQTVYTLSSLEEANLVRTATLDNHSSGRPEKVWEPAGSRDDLLNRIYTRHAERLLTNARSLSETLSNRIIDETREIPSVPETPVDWRVDLNWQPNGFHAPLLFAADRGYYADRNLELEINPRTGSSAALEGVASGAADVAIVGSGVLGRAMAAGRPVLPVALLYQEAMTALYTVRSVFGDSLERTEQLRNRTIGTPSGSETELLAKLFLSQANVLDDVQLVPTGGEEQSALLDGEADVVTGMVTDPAELEQAGYTVDSIVVAEQYPIPGPALVVSADVLADPPAALSAFLAGTLAGVAAGQTEPGEAAAAVTDRSTDTLTAERRRFEVATAEFGRTDRVRTRGWGWQTADSWDRLLTGLHQSGALSETE